MEQGLFQLAALGTTLAISIIGGLITGNIVKFFDEPVEFFSDDINWDYHDYNPKTKTNTNRISEQL